MIVESLIGSHVEIARSGKSEEYRLGLSALAAFDGLVHCRAYGVARLGRGQDALGARKILRRGKYVGLPHARRLHQSLVVQLGQNGAHAVIAQSARVAGGRYEVRTERVHLRERAYPARVAIVVGVSAAGQRRTARRLDRHNAVVVLAAKLLAHERRNQSAEIRSAAGAADDHIGLLAELAESGLGLKAYDGLVKDNLAEHRTQHIPVAGIAHCGLDRF